MIVCDGETSLEAVEFEGTTHGVVDLWYDVDGLLSCGYGALDTFKCPNCERRICYCAGHDRCDLCDECCIAVTHSERRRDGGGA